jgi:uracil-DNA glycosylase family 4
MDISHKYVKAHGKDDAKIMIVGECPTFNETHCLTQNRELDDILKSANIPRHQVWFSNACKYFVPPNPKVGRKIPFQVRAKNYNVDLEEQFNELRTEIKSISPNVILALGNTALWALTGRDGISDYRGSILNGMGHKVIATYDPKGLSFQESGEFKGYWNKHVILFDFLRARAQSNFRDIRLPQRTLTIAKSSYQLQDFRNRYSNFTRPAVDIEARGSCLPFCIGIAFTPTEGVTLPLWNKGEIESICQIPDSEMVEMWLIMSEMLSQNDVVGQNFKYDHDKIRRIGFNIRSLASDTMFKAFAISPELPKGLGFNTSIYTEEPFYKNEGMYEGRLEDLLLGCSRDACVTKEIDLKMDSDIDAIGMREYYENFIVPLHQFYLDMESEGFYIDRERRDALFSKYIAWSEKLSYELFQIVGEYINVGSPKQVAILLYENWKIPQRKGTGEEELTTILNLQSLKLSTEKRRGLEIILEKRRVDKTINTYLMALPDYDGKMKTTYFPCLETGRSSTGQLDPPIRPVLELLDSKNKKVKKVIGTAFQTMTKHGDIGADVRGQYIPEKGHVLIQADSAQAEARVVFLLADDEEALRDIDLRDYHAWTASWFFGGTESDYSKKVLGYEHPIRFVGKTLRHAGHLGASKKRAAISVNTDARKFKINVNITEKFAESALNTFHTKQPSIRKIFHNGIIEALNRDKRFLTASVPYGVAAKIGGRRQFLERWGDELFRQAYSYIPQRSISDNTKAAGMRLKLREPKLVRIVLESHDSLLFTVPESEVEYLGPMIREEMERAIRFDTCSLVRRDLIIPCELEIGYNYEELKKWKSSSN